MNRTLISLGLILLSTLSSVSAIGPSAAGWKNGAYPLKSGNILIPVSKNWRIITRNEHIDTGIPNTGWNYKPQIMDINGDGLSDVLLAYGHKWHMMLATSETSFASPVSTGIYNGGWENSPLVLDINGDGKDDLLVATNRKWQIMISKGNGFDVVKTDLSNVGWNYNPLIMDVNGDGRSDVVLAYGRTWNILFSTGRGFEEPVNTGVANHGWNYKTFSTDVNGDRKDDIVTAFGGKWHVIESNGRGFDPIESTGVSNEGWSTAQLIEHSDFSGPEICWLADKRMNDRMERYCLSLKNSSTPRYVSSSHPRNNHGSIIVVNKTTIAQVEDTDGSAHPYWYFEKINRGWTWP
ncbi:FG-GAP repeat domain-containing protein [Pleionea sediminis]|uniref:FG-GAP repeat domain-containing protein n=1 Tax=Pleionea sediminis TaxID=2569479 RepID=UPI001184F9C7|nr:VCBS repeat-containing protein [Pleionea sediminis]